MMMMMMMMMIQQKWRTADRIAKCETIWTDRSWKYIFYNNFNVLQFLEGGGLGVLTKVIHQVFCQHFINDIFIGPKYTWGPIYGYESLKQTEVLQTLLYFTHHKRDFSLFCGVWEGETPPFPLPHTSKEGITPYKGGALPHFPQSIKYHNWGQ